VSAPAVDEGGGRRLFTLLVGTVLALAATAAAAVYFATRSGSSNASQAATTSNPSGQSLVAGALSAIQTPTPSEFPTIPSAITYLIEQMRTQDLEAATRVMPLAFFYKRATFAWWANRLQSVDLNSFFPEQSFSKLYTVLGFLHTNFTLLGIELLRPGFMAAGTIVLSTPSAEQQLEAQLNPARLAQLSVRSVSVVFNTSKLGGMGQLGVNRVAEAHAMIGGLASPRTVDVYLDRYGSNWLISSINVLS
jgi:hypothetical protein